MYSRLEYFSLGEQAPVPIQDLLEMHFPLNEAVKKLQASIITVHDSTLSLDPSILHAKI